MLKVEGLSYAAEGRDIITGVSLEVGPDEFVGIVGPNGSGKSTLLKNLYKMLRPREGRVTLEGRDLLAMSNRDMAQRMAVVVQEQENSFDFTVGEVVMMGRHARKRLLEAEREEDRAAVRRALELVELPGLEARSFLTLSGGEKQRVLIARAAAQDTPLILLDEPTNHLDIRAQLQVMELLRSWDKSVLCALHDLNLAAAYCDRLYVMHQGRLAAGGTPREVLTPGLLREVFGVEAAVEEHPATGRLNIVYKGT